MTTTLARAARPLALLLALSVSLSACGDDDKTEDAQEAGAAAAQACRIAAVTDASLAGPRDAVASGEFTDGLLGSYDRAFTGLTEAVGGEGELPSEVTDAVIALAGAYSRTRGFVQKSMLDTSFTPAEGRTLVTAEERLYQELVDVCPALQSGDDEDDD